MRVRKKIFGTAERPRLSVFRSHKHMYAQLVDDEAATTLCAASTRSAELADCRSAGGNTDSAKRVGQLITEKAKNLGIVAVVFDRNGCLYHGRVKALAEAAREGGLKF